MYDIIIHIGGDFFLIDVNEVIDSEEDYNGLMETLYLSSIPGMEEKIVEGMKTSIEDCIPENQVW